VAYLLDTDWFIEYLAEASEAVSLIEDLLPSGIAMSVVTYMESYQGLMRDPDARTTTERFDRAIAIIPVLPFSLEVARRCASIREVLRRQGARVNQRALDLLIAATAIEHGLTLVTRNVADFQDIAELSIHRP